MLLYFGLEYAAHCQDEMISIVNEKTTYISIINIWFFDHKMGEIRQKSTRTKAKNTTLLLLNAVQWTLNILSNSFEIIVGIGFQRYVLKLANSFDRLFNMRFAFFFAKNTNVKKVYKVIW